MKIDCFFGSRNTLNGELGDVPKILRDLRGKAVPLAVAYS